MGVQAGEQYRLEQEVYFDGHLYGTNLGYPDGGEIMIVRGSDGFYYDGANFIATETWLPTTVDTSGLFHYYDFTIPAIAVNGDTFYFRIRITDDEETEIVGNMIVRPPTTGGGGGDAVRVFDAVDFVTGFPSTVG